MGVGFTLLALGFSLTNPWLIMFGFLAFAFCGKYVHYRYTSEAGIKGEKAVTEALRELDDSYFLINDLLLPKRGGNIDHILLSPKGIFCIETKNWTGDIRCNGDEWSKKGGIRVYPVESVSKQAWKNANDLSELIHKRLDIGVPVTPICVFTNASAKLKRTRPTLAVVRLAELTQYVRNAKPLTNLTADEISFIAQSILPKHLTEPVIHKEGRHLG